MRNFNRVPAILFGHVCATGLLLAATPGIGVATEPQTTENTERYVWDLRDLYPDTAAWDTERRRLVAELPKLKALRGTLVRDAASLRRGLDAISAERRASERIGVYATLEADVDQRVSVAIEHRELARKLASDLERSTSWVSNELLGIGAATIEKYIATDSGLAKHAFFLRDTVRKAPHTLTAEGERIMAAASTLRQDAESIYELTNADIPWPTIKLVDGADARLTSAGYTRYRQADNRADRKAAFDAFWQIHHDYQDAFGATLFAHVKDDVFRAQVRNYPGALSAALAGDNLPEGVYRTLVAETNAALPTLHRYLQLRKKQLRIPDDLRYYDIYPQMFNLKKTFPIEDAKTIALAATAPLGPEYTNTLREALNARWMHVYPAEGKRPGAYMSGSAYGVHPYLLLNYSDDYHSLSTFAHEWGHAMHAILADRAQPYETSNYSNFTDEITSITNEFLLNDYLMVNAKSKDERLFYLGEALENIRVTMFRQVMFAEFELLIHEAVERGEALTGEKLTQMYCGLLKHYYGEQRGVMRIDDLYCSEWSYIPHFYYDFDVFQYATSMVAAAYFAEQVGKGAAQRDTYLDVLRAGGSAYPYEILRKAGLDMATAAPYRALFARMNRIISQIEELERPPSTARMAASAVQTAAPAAPHAAANPDPTVLAGFPMNDEIRTRVREIRGLAVSPDEKSVLAEITDTTAEGGLPHLWLLGPGMKPRQLTFTRPGDHGGETGAQFSPDGKSVLFLASRNGARSLFRLSLAGGEPERLQITKNQKGEIAGSWGGMLEKDSLVVPLGYAFAPDGKYLTLWGEDPEDPAIKARKERKDDGYNHEEPEHRTFQYMVDFATGATRPVKLEGKFASASWSYDSADMIVATDPRSDLTGPDRTFWQMNPDTLAATRLDLPKTAGGVTYLPGHGRVVFTDRCAEDAPLDCKDLYVKDLATGQTKNLTPGFDGDFPENYTVLPNGDLALAILTHMRTRLATLSTTTEGITWHDFGLPVASLLVSNGNRSAWAFIGTGPTDPGTVFLTSQWGAKPVAIEAPALTPRTWVNVPSKLVSWQNEGLTIEGMLYMPPNIVRGTKVPLVMSIHGGPSGRFQDAYSTTVQMLVAEGWAVMQPNIRGSTGYGAKFMGANKNDLGGADFRDIMAGVDMLLKNYPIDEAKLALIGYSYGGEMAGFVVGKTDRFKAIVSGAPVVNQFSEYGAERGTLDDRWYYGRPWDHFADVWRQSPISTVMHAKTPFLLLQGQDDVTDPLDQSLEMWRALKQYGAPVALIVYPREGHAETMGSFRSLVSEEPWHGIDLRRRMFGFLRAAFAGDPDPLAIARKDVPTP